MLTPDRIVPTTCPYCGVGCQIDLHLRGGLIYRANGRRDNLVNHGNLCVKGRFGYDYVHAPDRLTQPLLRREEGRRKKEEGRGSAAAGLFPSFTPTTWDVALDTVAGELGRLRDQYGPDSVAVLTSAKCTNEENYLLQKFARAVIGTNTVDHCARL
ncbi:MAG: molybdopterin-dependent oxidoreductase [Chloroflexi bacterium]|nr:molybdopterin-dependent oxidoreductase [Chloroflexota bacterium]